MHRPSRWFLMFVGAFGWGIVTVNAIPRLEWVFSDGQVFLALGIGCMTVLTLLLTHVQRPVQDVWEAGREHGRRELIRELNRRRVVVSLEEHRAGKELA